jgi:hypothetical protein
VISGRFGRGKPAKPIRRKWELDHGPAQSLMAYFSSVLAELIRHTMEVTEMTLVILAVCIMIALAAHITLIRPVLRAVAPQVLA